MLDTKISTTGYQVIEPLDPELQCYGHPKNFMLALAMWEWLIVELKSELGSALQHVDVEVIKVTYHGSYPAIGVHYHLPERDVGPLLLDTITRIIRERPAGQFFEFVAQSPIDWPHALTTLMADVPPQA